MKNMQCRNENSNPIFLALPIGQGHVTIQLSWMRITNNFMNVFNGVTSPGVRSYHCVLSVSFNFNVAYGLKPQVSGISTMGKKNW